MEASRFHNSVGLDAWQISQEASGARAAFKSARWLGDENYEPKIDMSKTEGVSPALCAQGTEPPTLPGGGGTV